MRIYILYAKENWITDVLTKEWIEHNKELYTENIQEADVIWILSNYIAKTIPMDILKNKKVITTIHHIVPWKVDQSKKHHFKFLNEITDIFTTNQEICKNTLEKYVTKPIKIIPLWNNENIWKDSIYKKSYLRSKYNIEKNCYLVGSFQRDTEGNSIKNGTFNPKLEKGPDIFIKSICYLKKNSNQLKVLLTGKRRQYIMKELKKNGIEYYYFEMCDFETLNELYNCLDLYIVSSRVEGGPRAINECALTKTPLLSTNVGISSLICYSKSLFDMNNVESIDLCEVNTDYNYKQAQKYTIKNYMKIFTEKLFFK